MQSTQLSIGSSERHWTVGIPLLSKEIARDWNRVTLLLGRTLRSLATQKLPCSAVLIACHERPEMEVPAGLNVEFIQADFDRPRFTIELEVDKLRKLELIGSRHRARGAGLLYLLDADDVVRNDFSEQLFNHASKAVLLGRGYKLNSQTGKVIELPKFWRRCGSCAVVDCTIDELPSAPLTDVGSTFRRFLDTRHFSWHKFFRDRDWALQYVADPVVMYVVNHGQNDSELLSSFSWRWRLFNKFLAGSSISERLARSFSLELEECKLTGRQQVGFNIGQFSNTASLKA